MYPAASIDKMAFMIYKYEKSLKNIQFGHSHNLKKVKMETKTFIETWNARIADFAAAAGKTPEEIENALKTLVGVPSEDALGILSDPSSLSDDDLKNSLVGELKIPIGVFKKHLSKLRGPQTIAAPVEERAPSFDILPSVPEDESFIASLKVGGVLKVGSLEVMSAVKAAIANKVNLFGLPEIIKEKMEKFAEEQEEPVTKEYFELQKLVTSRSYAEVLSVLGVEGNFMTEARKKQFLQKLNQYLWSSLHQFNVMLMGWQESWMASVSNPAAMMSMMMMGTMGKPGAALPPGMMQPPETAGLHDESEAVIDSINKVFAGVGIPVARALAYDATRIKGVIENPSLPAAVGATNKDQMLKMLGMTVGADYVRLERNITRYTLAIMKYPEITVPNEDYAYLGAMIQLGNTIPWDKLEGTGIGRSL